MAIASLQILFKDGSDQFAHFLANPVNVPFRVLIAENSITY